MHTRLAVKVCRSRVRRWRYLSCSHGGNGPCGHNKKNSEADHASKKPEELPPCWNCDVPREHMHVFCDSCNVVQPPPQKSRKATNYFDLLLQKDEFDVDPQALTERYRSLVRRLHPDLSSQLSPREREYAQQYISIVNRGKEVLSDPVLRARHLLELRGFLQDDQGESEVLHDMEFVMRIFDRRERIDELRGDVEKNLPQLVDILQENEFEFRLEIKNTKEAFRRNDLPKAKDITLRLNYLYKIRRDLLELLPHTAIREIDEDVDMSPE
ncbi:MAG: hypothetical protein MHM6MM_000747 [Cercozoa sp. M6MM]